MDFFFHAVSAGALAHRLGERRVRRLALAAAVGVLPDATWVLAQMQPQNPWLYSFPHSLAANLGLTALVVLLAGPRIAFGNLLHVAVDIFTHRSSTMHLFFPWLAPRLPTG